MDSLINVVVRYSIQNHIITAENEAWFRYGLQKRLSTLFVFVPCAFLAVYLSGLWKASFFLVSFYFTRSQTNGFHARSSLGCLCGSIALEWVFIGLIAPHLSVSYVCLLMIISVIVIFLLAPYNHPKMSLNQDEFAACKKNARMRISLLVLLTLSLYRFRLTECAEGISLGSAMTSLLLCLAYISDWRIQNGKNANHDKHRPQNLG